MSDEAKNSMQEWAKAIAAPVVVAIVVGMGTAYLTAQEAVAVHEERLATHSLQLDHHRDDISRLENGERDTQEALIRLEAQLERIEGNLEECD